MNLLPVWRWCAVEERLKKKSAVGGRLWRVWTTRTKGRLNWGPKAWSHRTVVQLRWRKTESDMLVQYLFPKKKKISQVALNEGFVRQRCSWEPRSLQVLLALLHVLLVSENASRWNRACHRVSYLNHDRISFRILLLWRMRRIDTQSIYLQL